MDLGYEARTKRNGGDVSYAQAKEHREEFFKELKSYFLRGFGWLLLEVRVRYFQVLSLSCDGIFRWRKKKRGCFVGKVDWRDLAGKCYAWEGCVF